jgi:hypothetical protein
MGIRWLGGRGLHTTRSIDRTFFRVALDVASERENEEKKKNYALLAGSRHIGLKYRESPPPKVKYGKVRLHRYICLPHQRKKKTSGIWRVAGSPLLQTQTLRAVNFFKCASSLCA